MSNLFYDAGSPAKGRKILLATTAYDSPDASYTYSIARSREALHKAGLPTAYLLLQGNCNVDDARNVVVRDFLNSDCTEMVFLDADVSWEPEDLVQLCQFDCDVVGGVYPYRRDGGEGMPVRNLRGSYEPENGLLEVEGLPTGFLRIKRHVLELMSENCEWFNKKGGNVPLIFDRDVMDGGRRGGDIRFCMQWREMGGGVYAASDLRLGHCGKVILRDSLSASLRRQMGTSLNHVSKAIKEYNDYVGMYHEVTKYINNPWGAQEDVLSLAVNLARKAGGPIIEAGSGLSTILMAAATDQMVYCIEHNPHFASQIRVMAYEAEVENIAIIHAEIKDGWYDIHDWDELPKKFSVGLNDGPPRILADRMKFFDYLGDMCQVILSDDADNEDYASKITEWADARSRPVEIDDHRAAIIFQEAA